MFCRLAVFLLNIHSTYILKYVFLSANIGARSRVMGCNSFHKCYGLEKLCSHIKLDFEIAKITGTCLGCVRIMK